MSFPRALFFQVITDAADQPVQRIMLATDKRKNMDDAVREYLTAEPREIDLIDSFSTWKDSCYMIWRLEHTQPFQDAAGLSGESFIGAEPSLAAPLLEEGITPVYIAGLEDEPYLEYIESFGNLEYRFDKIKNVHQSMIYRPFPFLDPPSERLCVIARDDVNNLTVTLQKFLSLSTERGICPGGLCTLYAAGLSCWEYGFLF
jgi:hypothetical protein